MSERTPEDSAVHEYSEEWPRRIAIFDAKWCPEVYDADDAGRMYLLGGQHSPVYIRADIHEAALAQARREAREAALREADELVNKYRTDAIELRNACEPGSADFRTHNTDAFKLDMISAGIRSLPRPEEATRDD